MPLNPTHWTFNTCLWKDIVLEKAIKASRCIFFLCISASWDTFHAIFSIFHALENCNMVMFFMMYWLILLNTHAALIGQFTHAWTSTGNNNRASALNQFLHARLFLSCKCVTRRHSVMSQSHRSKGRIIDDAFQEQYICGREELLLVQTLTFLTFKTF